MYKRKFNQVLAALLLAGLTGLTSCRDDKNTDVPKPATELRLTINGEYYDITLPATETVNLATLSTETTADIHVENAADFQKLTIGGTDARSGKCAITVGEIAKDRQIEIAYTTGDQSGTVHLNTLHTGIPVIEATGKGVTPGDFYLSFIFQRLVMKYDNDGRILFYRFDPTSKAGTFNEQGYWDFKKHTFDGRTYYSYHAPDYAFTNRAFTGYNPGMRILLDDRFMPIDTIHALPSLDGYLFDGEPIDGHDFYFFSPSHYIISAYIDREVGDRALSVAYLQEVQDGEVVFDWWSSDHPEMEGWTSPAFDTNYDYVHFNSIQVLSDGNWLCSFRHLSSIVKIDRVGKTGDILWRIDGESLPEDQCFCGQHYATLHDDGTLTLFDNGNGHSPQVTRVLRLDVNAQTGEVTGGGNMLNPGGDYFSQACGAVQLFGQRFTVGWGWSIEEGNNTRLVTEHDTTGREVFGLRRTAADCLPNSVNPSYRCVKYE